MTAWIVAVALAVMATNGLTIWWVSALEIDLRKALERAAEERGRARRLARDVERLGEVVACLQGLPAKPAPPVAPMRAARVVPIEARRERRVGEYAVLGTRDVPVVSEPLGERERTKAYRSPGGAATGEAMRAEGAE